jgi:hypothetical protein
MLWQLALQVDVFGGSHCSLLSTMPLPQMAQSQRTSAPQPLPPNPFVAHCTSHSNSQQYESQAQTVSQQESFSHPGEGLAVQHGSVLVAQTPSWHAASQLKPLGGSHSSPKPTMPSPHTAQTSQSARASSAHAWSQKRKQQKGFVPQTACWQLKSSQPA